jgi:hypothetical protein
VAKVIHDDGGGDGARNRRIFNFVLIQFLDGDRQSAIIHVCFDGKSKITKKRHNLSNAARFFLSSLPESKGNERQQSDQSFPRRNNRSRSARNVKPERKNQKNFQ